MTQKKKLITLIIVIVFILFNILLSQEHQVMIDFNVIDVFDGSSISADITMESIEKDIYTYKTNSRLITQILPGGYNIKVEAENHKPLNSFLSIDNSFSHDVTISMHPIGVFWGYVRNSITMKPIENVSMTLQKGDKIDETKTDKNGYYSFHVTSGKYSLETNHKEYKEYKKDYYVDPGLEFIESINLIQTDVSKVLISDYASYSISGNRNGKVARYADSTYLKIKKNLDGQYLLEQSYVADGRSGKNLILFDGKDAWIAEGEEFIPEEFVKQTPEFAEATKLLIKTNEDFMDYINQLRFEDYAEVTILGEETINNILCDKIHVYVNDPGSWIGWVDFDVDIYVMKTGKLRGLPTKIVGITKGSDEVGHRFKLNLDLSITDVGNSFTFPKP